MPVLRLECVCEECSNVSCYLTIEIDAKYDQAYKPPTKCIANDKLVAWRIDNIIVGKEADA